jgi:hypothetical protein
MAALPPGRPVFIQCLPVAFAEDYSDSATVGGMNRRRSEPDALASTSEPTWLVVRDPFHTAIEVIPLEPHADLRTVLNAAREVRIAEGWKADELEKRSSYFYCTKDEARMMVGIERSKPTLGHR